LKNTKNQWTAIRISTDLKRKLSAACEANRRKEADLITMIVEQHIDEYMVDQRTAGKIKDYANHITEEIVEV
jgi:predicted DNA-binding protein